MRFSELKRNLTENFKFGNVIFVAGQDSYFREQTIKALIEYFNIGLLDMNVSSVDFEKATQQNIDNLFDSLLTYPFMDEKKITIVNNWSFEKDIKKIDEFKNGDINFSVLIIVCEEVLPVLKKLKYEEFIDCSRENANVLQQWVTNEFKKNEIKISTENANTIVLWCANNMAKITKEVEKLVSYKKSKDEITLSDIEAVVSKESEFKFYEFANFVANKDREKALTMLNIMLTNNENINSILISVYNYFRNMFYIVSTNLTNNELSNLLKVKEYPIKLARGSAKSFNKARLKTALDIIESFDVDLKCGRRGTESIIDVTVQLLNV